MNRLRVAFAPYWQSIQHALFPQLERVLGPLTEKQQQLVQTLEVKQMIPRRLPVPGRPPKDRAAMARAFVAKAVYDMPTTYVEAVSGASFTLDEQFQTICVRHEIVHNRRVVEDLRDVLHTLGPVEQHRHPLLGVQRPVRSGDDPQIELLGAVLAEPAELVVLEYPQQLRLGAR